MVRSGPARLCTLTLLVSQKQNTLACANLNQTITTTFDCCLPSFAAVSQGSYLRSTLVVEPEAEDASGPEEPKSPREQRETVKSKIESLEEGWRSASKLLPN